MFWLLFGYPTPRIDPAPPPPFGYGGCLPEGIGLTGPTATEVPPVGAGFHQTVEPLGVPPPGVPPWGFFEGV